MAKAGLEPAPDSSGKTTNRVSGGAESGAVGADFSPVGADLQSIIEAWPKLPESTKAGIIAIVRAAGGVK